MRQGNVFSPVCHSVHRVGCGRHPPVETPKANTPPPWAKTPCADVPWADIPLPSACWGTHHPLPSACWDTHLPCAVHAGIPSASGQYASYWNALLFIVREVL